MLEPAHGLAQSRPYIEPAPRPWRGIFASLFAREAQCSPGAVLLAVPLRLLYGDFHLLCQPCVRPAKRLCAAVQMQRHLRYMSTDRALVNESLCVPGAEAFRAGAGRSRPKEGASWEEFAKDFKEV